MNLCAQEGAPCWGVEWTGEHTLRLTTFRHKLSLVKKLAQRAGCEISVEGRRGLPDFLGRFRRRYAFLIGLALIMADIKLPEFLHVSFQYVGNLATPLSLIVIGIEMSSLPLRSVQWDRDLIGALTGRFIVCPLCVLALLPFVSVTPMSAQVFTMQASMPAMTQMTVVAKAVGADVKYATEISFITVVLGLIVIPSYMFLIQYVL